MTTVEAQAGDRRPFTLAGVGRGLKVGWPFLFSSGAIGLIMGVTYRELGLDAIHAFLLSALLYSGTAQAVTAAMWTVSPLPLAAMMLAILSVNARYLVMGANLRQHFSDVPLRRMLPALFLLADANWVLTVAKAEKGDRDVGLLVGSGLPMWSGWVAGTVAGHALNLAPKGALALAFAFLPLGLIVSMIPAQMKGKARAVALPWVITAAGVWAASYLMPLTWATLAGAALGTAIGAMRGRDDAGK
ncbi:AzlC family ABC transporter permease [Lacibacterium aquatile]|uniref:AzlC family ABC transporter permease n=1 Tax=Lacibacterium aquatile TaxID=1168082 RepID=A0ABW5DWC8_9PROT